MKKLKKYSIANLKRVSKEWKDITGRIYHLGHVKAKIAKLGNPENFLEYTFIICAKDKVLRLSFDQVNSEKDISKVIVDLPFSQLTMSDKEFTKTIIVEQNK